jgi:hypothetical protein
MRYHKVAQFIPGKGDAWMYSESDDKGVVLRTLTYVPATGELERIPDPVVKFLFRPEKLLEAQAAEFLELWGRG